MSKVAFPQGLATLSVQHQTAQGRSRTPEYSRPTGITLDIFQIVRTDLRFQSTLKFEGDQGILDAHSMITREGWQLLTYNAFNFDYRILSERLNLEYYLANTIDLFYGVWQLINATSISETGRPHTQPGELEFLALFLANLPHSQPRPSQRGEDLAKLWHRILSTRKVNAAGTTYPLTNAIGSKLFAATPFFSSLAEWATPLVENGSLLGLPARGHHDAEKAMFAKRYKSYR